MQPNTVQNPRWRELTPEQQAALPIGTRAQTTAHGPHWTRTETCWLRFSPSSPDLSICMAPDHDAFVQIPVEEVPRG